MLYCEILSLVLAKFGRFMLQQSLEMVQINTCVSVSALMTVLLQEFYLSRLISRITFLISDGHISNAAHTLAQSQI